jgi:hypothetical protein
MAGAARRQSNWTPEEDRRLLELIKAKKSLVFISANLKRPAKTVRDHLAFLARQEATPKEVPEGTGKPSEG